MSIILRINYVHWLNIKYINILNIFNILTIHCKDKKLLLNPSPWRFLQHLCVSTTGHKHCGPMTNMCPPARPRGPPGRTGHSELRLALGSPFITACPSALFCPGRPSAAPWINRGHVWTADPRPWKWVQQQQRTIRVGISKAIHQASKKIPMIYVLEGVFYNYWPFSGGSSRCWLTILAAFLA